MLTAPTLWQPRRGAWWRLPRLDALLMAHIKKSASTGHMLKTGTGHLSKGCGSPTGCDLCDYTTLRVILGVTPCTCTNYYKLSADPSGTYDLSYNSGIGSGSNCYWGPTDTGITLDQWDDTGCTGSVLTSTTVYIWGNTSSFFGGTATVWCATALFGKTAFRGSVTPFSACTGSTAISNENSGSGTCGTGDDISDPGNIYAYDGTATVTWF